MNTTQSSTPALDLIRRGWTQETCARDKDDNPAYTTSKFACKWCAYGALLAAYPNEDDFLKASHKLTVALVGVHRSYIEWNDTPGRTQAEVIALFEKAGV